jgi:hypothetical protein
MAFEHRVMHLAAREQLGKRMPDELADAQLALRRAARTIAMLTAGHGSLIRFVVPWLEPDIPSVLRRAWLAGQPGK